MKKSEFNARPAGTDATEQDDVELARTLLEGLQAGATVKDMQGVSDEMLEGVYAYAHRFYSNGQLEQAEAFFRFLCLYDFYNSEYPLGLGAVHQMKGDYQKAIDLYAVAFALSRNDYRPMLHTGQCQLALGKLDVARGCFEVVQRHSRDATQLAQAAAYLQALDNPQDRAAPADEPVEQ